MAKKKCCEKWKKKGEHCKDCPLVGGKKGKKKEKEKQKDKKDKKKDGKDGRKKKK